MKALWAQKLHVLTFKWQSPLEAFVIMLGAKVGIQAMLLYRGDGFKGQLFNSRFHPTVNIFFFKAP